MIKVNGEMRDVAEIPIQQYLDENGYKGKRVAVEVNGEIIPRSLHNQTILHAKDVVEIVSFVGGG